MIFESHAHYDDDWYDEDREDLLSNFPKRNVGMVVNVGASIESSRASLNLSQKYAHVYAAVGVHPDEVDCLEAEGLDPIRRLLDEPKVVAVGETGLDYYRKEGTDYKEKQKKWFLQQLELAVEFQKPVIVHSRDAAEDTMNLITTFCNEHPQWEKRGVIHCYSYSPEMAREYIQMGFYIGVGGVVTFKNAKKLVDTVREIPLDHILVETDSPYLSPEPFRGQRNESANISYVIDKIAEIKGISLAEVEQQTEYNGRQMYGV